MKRIILILLALALGLNAAAQETYLFAQRDTCDLYLDIWRAQEGSQTTVDSLQKPAVLFAFGGGFVSGKRNDPYLVNWYKKLNQNGYDVVAFDYRLGMKDYKVGKGLSGAMKASGRFELSQDIGVEDAFDAIKFLYTHPELGIDANNLVVSGNSAGAIISVSLAHKVANGEVPDGLPEGFSPKGVMSFAGAVISTSGAPKFKSQPCQMILFHGTADKAVAYKSFGAFGHGLWGSSYIAKKLQKKDWPLCIYRFKDRTHDVAAYMEVLLALELEFLEKVARGVSYSVDAVVDDPSLPTWGNLSLDDIY